MSLLDQFIFSAIAPPSSEALIPRFREWWWDEFDTGADSAEYHAESAEAASELLPILRNLEDRTAHNGLPSPLLQSDKQSREPGECKLCRSTTPDRVR